MGVRRLVIHEALLITPSLRCLAGFETITITNGGATVNLVCRISGAESDKGEQDVTGPTPPTSDTIGHKEAGLQAVDGLSPAVMAV